MGYDSSGGEEPYWIGNLTTENRVHGQEVHADGRDRHGRCEAEKLIDYIAVGNHVSLCVSGNIASLNVRGYGWGHIRVALLLRRLCGSIGVTLAVGTAGGHDGLIVDPEEFLTRPKSNLVVAGTRS